MKDRQDDRTTMMLEYAKARLEIRFDGVRTLWAALPRAAKILAKLQMAAVATALCIAAAVPALHLQRGFDFVAFAVPAVEHAAVPWKSEVDAFGYKVSQAFGVGRSTANEFAGWILEASERQHLEPELLASLVLTESSFRKHARSAVGAIGPAQIRPEYWSQFCGSSNLHDPAENIYCGAQVLSHLKERCDDDTACALQAYNIGIHSSERHAGSRYVSKIDRYRDHLLNFPL